MLVTYTGGNEVIITTLEREHEVVTGYFGPSMGRDLEEYDREVEGQEAAIVFRSEIKRG